MIAWAAQRTDSELVIRVHPHLSKKHIEDQQFWNNLGGKNVLLIESFSTVDTYGLIDSSDLVVAYASTVGMEATYWGKPSIALSRTAYTVTNCTYNPQSLDELIMLLCNEQLPSIPKEKCFPTAYFLETFGNFEHKYYQQVSGENGTFCGKELTMDLRLIHILKRSALGKHCKKIKNEWRTALPTN